MKRPWFLACNGSPLRLVLTFHVGGDKGNMPAIYTHRLSVVPVITTHIAPFAPLALIHTQHNVRSRNPKDIISLFQYDGHQSSTTHHLRAEEASLSDYR
jgi:hypothetical protein